MRTFSRVLLVTLGLSVLGACAAEPGDGVEVGLGPSGDKADSAAEAKVRLRHDMRWVRATGTCDEWFWCDLQVEITPETKYLHDAAAYYLEHHPEASEVPLSLYTLTMTREDGTTASVPADSGLYWRGIRDPDAADGISVVRKHKAGRLTFIYGQDEFELGPHDTASVKAELADDATLAQFGFDGDRGIEIQFVARWK